MNKLIFCLILTLVSNALRAQLTDSGLATLVQSFSRTSAVTGREDEATQFVQALFKAGTFKKDKLGNIILTIGGGYPRRLFTAPLDEPGYVISDIQDNGYLRITPVGYGQSGYMFHQFLEGNEVKINTEKGTAYGVAVVPSVHFEGVRAAPENNKPVYQWQEGFIDVGQSSAAGVQQAGIRLLDPLTTNKKPVIIGQQYIAAPAVKSKSATIALAIAAATLMQSKFSGTVVIAFTTLELLNGKGIEDVVNEYGPFNQVIRFNRFLTGPVKDGAEVLSDRQLPFTKDTATVTKPAIHFRESGATPDWGQAEVYAIGLPSEYTYSPVEMVSLKSIVALARTWLDAVEDKDWALASLSVPATKSDGKVYNDFTAENSVLEKLIALYGVSGSEKPVRDFILSQLPSWAKPVTDGKGNIILTFGKGPHIAFVAHMDEVGYVVDSIREDGTLILRQRGGFFNFIWEGHTAIVHADKDIPAVFEPRSNYMTATARSIVFPPAVFVGFVSRSQALQAGVKEGYTTVTMPKKMIRLSEDKATARGFDDRAGCAALLLALRTLKPAEIPFKITFVWSVGEETGLTGSTYAADSLKDLRVVYPIDTYVSSDDPQEPHIFAYCPLGSGAVIRVLESINFVSRENLSRIQALAARNKIAIQYGMTAGGTDGQGFLKYDIPSVPLSWPGRYSHSPIEILDFRDLNSLVHLIQAIIADSNHPPISQN
jgi:putative aminopeptidase